MKWVVGGLVLVAIAVWMVIDPSGFRGGPEFNRFMGFVGLAFFGWMTVGWFRSRAKPTELILTSEGFEVRGHRTGALVPWRDVERFFIVTVRTSKFISYVLTPMARAALQERTSFNSTFSLTGADGQVPANLESSAEEVRDLLETWRVRHAPAA